MLNAPEMQRTDVAVTYTFVYISEIVVKRPGKEKRRTSVKALRRFHAAFALPRQRYRFVFGFFNCQPLYRAFANRYDDTV